MMLYRGRQYRQATPEEAAEYRDVGFTDQGRWGNEGSGILYTTGDQILLLLRSWDVEEPNTWGLPGGAIPECRDGGCMDPYESALNEVEEELGLVPAADCVDQYQYREEGFRYTTFICRVDPSAVDLEFRLNWENDRWGWFNREELQDLDLHFGVTEVLNHQDPFR